jgi:hypothetical protein
MKKAAALFALFLLPVFFAGRPVAAQAPTFPLDLGAPTESTGLCAPGEKRIFGCKTADGKEMSVCSSKVLNEKIGSLRYLFGAPGAIEIEFPKQKVKPQSVFRYSRTPRFQQNNIRLRFQLDKDRYEIFDETKSENGMEKRTCGVRIKTAGTDAVTTETLCAQPPSGNLWLLENFLPHDPK